VAPAGDTLRLSFVRFLFGHAGPVVALALADGRCVSLGADGSVWAWDLEADTGAEVASVQGQSARGRDTEKGTVIFDERRILSAGTQGVVMRCFDV